MNKFDIPSEKELNKMKVLQRYESFHISPGIVYNNIWQKNLPLYKQLFPSVQLTELSQYRNEVVKAVNLTKVTERFRHPDQMDNKWKKQYGDQWGNQSYVIHNWHNLEK